MPKKRRVTQQAIDGIREWTSATYGNALIVRGLTGNYFHKGGEVCSQWDALVKDIARFERLIRSEMQKLKDDK